MFHHVHMQFSKWSAVLLITLLFGCSHVSRDEVAKQSSPDVTIEAILYETNGGATTSFGYEAVLRATNTSQGVIVANLYGAVRNASAYGVNLKWLNDRELVLEYLTAKS